MIRALERFFSGNSTDYILDTSKEDPVVRATTWFERVVAWLRPEWLSFFKKNVYLINEVGRKTIAKLSAETLSAGDTDAQVRRLKWARTKLTLIATANTSHNGELKEQLFITARRTLEQIKLSSFSPEELKIKKEHEEIYLESVNEELAELAALFKAGSPTPPDMERLLGQIDHQSGLSQTDPSDLIATSLNDYVPLDGSVSSDELIVRLTNIRFWSRTYPSQVLVDAKNRYAQKKFCELLIKCHDKAPSYAYASLTTFYENQEDLLLQDIKENELLLSNCRKQLAIDFIDELKTTSLKGVKHLLSYPLFFTGCTSCQVTTSGEEVKRAYKDLEQRNKAEALLQEDEFARITHLCEILVPRCTLSS